MTGMKGTYQSNSSESQSTRKVTAISKLLEPGWNAFSDQRDRNEVCGNRERKTCPVLVVRHGENFLSFGNCARPCLICPLFFSRPRFQRRTSIHHEKTKGRRRNKSKGRNIKARLFSALYKPDTRRLLALCNFTRCVRSYGLTQSFPSRGNASHDALLFLNLEHQSLTRDEIAGLSTVCVRNARRQSWK